MAARAETAPQYRPEHTRFPNAVHSMAHVPPEVAMRELGIPSFEIAQAQAELYGQGMYLSEVAGKVYTSVAHAGIDLLDKISHAPEIAVKVAKAAARNPFVIGTLTLSEVLAVSTSCAPQTALDRSVPPAAAGEARPAEGQLPGIGVNIQPFGDKTLDDIGNKLANKLPVTSDEEQKYQDAVKARAAATATAGGKQTEAAATPPTGSTVAETKPNTPAETKKEQPCAILPEEYCAKAELIEWTYQGTTYLLVGFRNLPKDVPIFSPIKGQVGKTNADPPFHGSLASVKDITDINSPNFTLMGDVLFDNNLSIDVEKGGIIAKTGSNNPTGDSPFDEFELILRVTQKDPKTGNFFTPTDIVDQAVPGVLKKQISKKIVQTEGLKFTVVDRYTS